MEKKALYRKYRPAAFEGLIGQDHVKITLENAIKNNAISHAYVFTGPRGTGKTSTARLFAKALNCANPEGINPCGQCPPCLNDTDIIENDAASNNGVDDIRELRENISLSPMYGKYKIYILDEAHMMTQQAFNAFLKTLEEPPAHARFILATTEVHKLPATILSRCQRFDFRRIKNSDIVSRLEYILNAENRTAQKEALELIAQVSAGGMRDSISLLDQALARKASPGELVTLEDVLALTGAVDVRAIGQLLYLIANKRLEEALMHFNKCFDDGKEPKFFVEELMIYLRDVLVRKKLGTAATLKKASTDSNFETVAASLEVHDIFNYLEVLQKTLNDLKYHHDLQLLLEMSIIRMVKGERSSLQQQIDEIRSLISNETFVSKQTNVEPVVTSSNSELNARILVNDSEHDVVVLEDPINFLQTAKELHANGVDWSSALPSETNLNEQTSREPITNQEHSGIPNFVEPATGFEVQDIPNFVEPATSFEVQDIPNFVEPATGFEVQDIPNFAEPVNNSEVPMDFPNFAEPVNNSEVPMDFPNFAEPVNNSEVPMDFPNFAEPVNNSEVPMDFPNFAEPVNNSEVPMDFPNFMEPVNHDETLNASSHEQNEFVPTGNIILSEIEMEALEVLKSSSNEELDNLKKCLDNIAFELGNINLSSRRIFSEFEVGAVSSSHFILIHNDKVHVQLINKLSHKKNISEVLENVYKPLDYIAITRDEWTTISKLI